MNRITTAATGLVLLSVMAGGLQGKQALAADDPSPGSEAVTSEQSAPPEDQTQSSPPLPQDSQQTQTSPEPPETQQANPPLAEAQPSPDIAPSATGDLISTIVQLREALRLQPDLVKTHVELGSVLYQIGDIDSAIQAYREAVRREPDQVDARLKLATTLMVKHEWAGAREELQAALTLQPDLAQAHYALGIVRYTLGDHAGAIEAYRDVLRLRPEYADAHYNLGLVLKLTNQEEAAAYEFLTAAASGVPQAQYFIGAAYASGLGVERDLHAAIRWWFRAADQDVTHAKEGLAQLRREALLKETHSPEQTRAALNAFAAFRKELWRQFPDLEDPDPEESVGVGLLKHGRTHEAVSVLIREAYALSDQAQNALETLYEHGVEGQVDPYDRRILAYWKTTAEEGLPRPRLALARIYSHGLGVPQDLRKATGLLKNVPGERAKELLKEISAMQQNGTQATRNAKSESTKSP